MGVFSCDLRVTSLDGERSLDTEAIVDTGATYTVLPARMLEELRIAPARRLTVRLADGRLRAMDVGRAWITIDGFGEVTPVAFGTDGMVPLLGAVTLQTLGLAVDPVTERLVTAETYL